MAPSRPTDFNVRGASTPIFLIVILSPGAPGFGAFGSIVGTTVGRAISASEGAAAMGVLAARPADSPGAPISPVVFPAVDPPLPLPPPLNASTAIAMTTTRTMAPAPIKGKAPRRARRSRRRPPLFKGLWDIYNLWLRNSPRLPMEKSMQAAKRAGLRSGYEGAFESAKPRLQSQIA